MAVQRLRIVDEAPADGQAPLDVVIDGLENGGQSITSVEVSTLFANQPATAELEGTVLKLGIPKGGDRSGRNIADYLAGAQVTTQTVFGMSYLQSFLGVNDIFQTNKVAKGTMWATPVENIHLYGADFNALADAGLSYTTQDGGLIGVHHEANYDRASAETYVTTGAMMIAENLDYIAKDTIKKGA